MRDDISPAAQGNRAFLRTATQSAHTAAEDRWTDHGSFASRAQYDGFLSVALECHLKLGLPAAEARMQGIAFERHRIVALAQDLNCDVPVRSASPSGISADYAWGVSYALNGSAIGASILLKSDHRLKSWPTAYLALLQGYAKAGHLAQFFDALEAAPLDAERALQGAVDVFDMIGSAPLHLSQGGCPFH